MKLDDCVPGYARTLLHVTGSDAVEVSGLLTFDENAHDAPKEHPQEASLLPTQRCVDKAGQNFHIKVHRTLMRCARGKDKADVHSSTNASENSAVDTRQTSHNRHQSRPR